MTKYDRLGSRYSRWAILVVLLVISVAGVWLGISGRQTPSHISVAIATDPVVVWSWDRKGERSVIVEIPADTLVEAVDGYGRYALGSLWKLGQLEGARGSVFSDTLADVVGIPIPWYIGLPNPEQNKLPDNLAILKDIFSLKNAVTYFRGGFRTNLNLFAFFQLLKSAYLTKVENTTVIDLTRPDSLTEEELPDGSRAKSIDTNRLESLIGHAYEDNDIRREAFNVAVYNTTSLPTLGLRFTRLLTHLGVKVIFVGNSLDSVEGVCEIGGREGALTSYTGKEIQTQLGCRQIKREKSSEERFDISIFVGRGYAKRFESHRR